MKNTTKYTRYNSGKHFLDSGGESGRLWQQPIEKRSVWFDKSGEYSVISTDHLLSFANIHPLHQQFYKWEQGDSWFDGVLKFMESHGYTQVARDNTYNSENDLSQDFVWEVWDNADSPDWIYSDSVVIVIYVHTGADIRGGYSKPIICTFDGDHCMPLDWVCGFYSETFTNEQNERLEVGYSSHPCSELHDMNLELVSVPDDGEYAIFKESDGTEHKVYPQEPYWGM